MAHVQAVGKVVRAEFTHEELVKERRLVRRFERVQIARNDPKRIVPRNRLVVLLSGSQNDRLRDASGLIHLVIAQLRNLLKAELRKELQPHALLGRLRRDRLGAVLTKLERAAVVLWIRSAAARTVKALPLVQSQHRSGPAHQSAAARAGDQRQPAKPHNQTTPIPNNLMLH